MIEFIDVNKTYDNKQYALSNINIQIDKGEFVFLVGPSGAGKSTFIKLLLKEVDPTSGIIKLNDTVVNKLKRRELPIYRRKIGMISGLYLQ